MDPLTGETNPPERGVKAYPATGLTVTFEAARCIHAAECVRGLPGVFDSSARPWIRPDRADLVLVVEVVSRCPSGALKYTLSDGTSEPATTPVTLTRSSVGELYVRGEVVVGHNGTVQTETRAILCACGNSGNQPYCDRSGDCREEPVRDPSTLLD